MMRKLLLPVRHLLTAVLLLAAVACGAEVALRAARVRAGTPDLTRSEIVVASPHCHLEMRPLVRRTDAAGSRTLRISSLGTRGEEPATPKPPGSLRLLVLGDESMLALDQPEALTFPARMQASLAAATGRDVEVINAGLPGGCPLLSRLQFRHRLASLQPDSVLLVLHTSDVADDLRVRPLLRTSPDGEPIACPHPTAGVTGPTWRSELAVVDLLSRQLADRWLASTPPVRSDLRCPTRALEWSRDPLTWAEPLGDMVAPIAGLRDDAERMGAAFTLTAVPSADAVHAGGPNPWRVIGQFAAHERIDWFDPTDGLARHSQAGELFGTSASCGRIPLTATGHERLAAAVAGHLSRPR